MPSETPDPASLVAVGVQALRAGDPGRARAYLEQARASGATDQPTLFALAIACHETNDLPAVHNAVDEILRTDPQNLRALLMKADCYAEQGNGLAASSFYQAVTALAPRPDSLPPEIAAEIERANRASDGYAAEMISHLKRALVDVGYDEATSSPRFRESIEMLAGVKKRYIEEPKSYYFPGMPARGFYERNEFEWVQDVEAATDDVANELTRFLEKEDAFVPYVHAEKDRPNIGERKLLDSLDWGALFLWRDGELVEEIAPMFPKTLAMLEKVPLDHAEGRAPMALFSRLTPGTRIEPHTGLVNTRLICHLPVIVSGNCFLRAGNETREHKRGKMLFLNDTIEHEAWNNSDSQRIVLLFSIWRPELTQEEKRLAAAVISSALSFSGGDA